MEIDTNKAGKFLKGMFSYGTKDKRKPTSKIFPYVLTFEELKTELKLEGEITHIQTHINAQKIYITTELKEE